MSSALQRFFEATDGGQWVNKMNWESGEPCTDRWFGVLCCPATHPHLTIVDTDKDDGECRHADGHVMGDGHVKGMDGHVAVM